MYKKTNKGVGVYIYPVRAFGYLLATTSILSFHYTFWSDTHSAVPVYVFAGILLIYPHLAFLYYHHKNYRRQAEFDILLVDMFLIAWINHFVGFSPIYGLPYFVANSSSNFATNGFRLFLKGIISFGLGASIAILSFGFDFHYTYNFWGSLPSYIYLLLATHYIGLISYFKGKTIRNSKQLLEENNELLRKNRDEITLNNKALEQANFNIKESINYADSIQKSILPSRDNIAKIFPNYMLLYRPRDIVSGDFYWTYQNKDYKILLVADCTGHGVPGAFMSLIGQMFVNEIIMGDQIFEPNEILDALHQKITFFLNQKTTDNRDGMDVGILTVCNNKNIVKFAGAKHSLLIIEKQKNSIIKGSVFGIGGENYHQKIHFDLHTLELKTNMRFYLYSDGFQDQFGGKKDKKMGGREVRELLTRLNDIEIEEQEDILNNFLETWMQEANETQIDDILILGIETKI